MPDANTGSSSHSACGRPNYWTREPTVLIEKLPAARVGDSLVCVGPPDSIIEGSATVLIGGMPAARMGDATAHGGEILTGAFNVLIGG